MSKGLRCPNCDTTINRKVVHDWIVNKRAPHLQCPNQFCNTRWQRSVLQANAVMFSGGADKVVAKPSSRVKAPPKPAERKVAARKVTTPQGRWLDRIRKIARGHAKKHGVVSVDVLRRWADINKDYPENPSIWGSVFQGSEWQVVSKMNSTYSSNRSRQVSVWVLKADKPALVGV